jgi:hypothetical protein
VIWNGYEAFAGGLIEPRDFTESAGTRRRPLRPNKYVNMDRAVGYTRRK